MAKKRKAMEPQAETELGEVSRIAIPTIGSRFTLAEPWAFMLHSEGRNLDFMGRAGVVKENPNSKYRWDRYERISGAVEFALPAGTSLTVDRIYVRKGVDAYDSVTFVLRKGDHGSDKKVYGRFWVKLGDVNRIVCRWHQATLKQQTGVSLLTQLAAASVDPSDA